MSRVIGVVAVLLLCILVVHGFQSTGRASFGRSLHRLSMNNDEQTYIMVKPDGVQRGVVGNIISRFEQKGYVLKGLKLTTPAQSTLEEHYKDLADKPFFPKLMGYMTSGPVCAMVWEGKNVVKSGRAMLGATNPADSAPGTIRGDFALDVGRNICHGSDSVENGQKEIGLWFPEGLNEYESHSSAWIYE